MNHLPPMIVDLAVILAAAAVSTLIFSKLRQPVVLGYLVAGFVVGPYFPFLPNVVDSQGVAVWAEIGVIFLLFGLGLEFSFKKLAKVGKSAFIGASFEIITMSAAGYLLGRALGWKTMDSIYLGAILSMSSTTIIIRAFDEAGLKGKAFASLVFGILIVEDLMAILLMVILSALSIPGSFSGANLTFLSARLVFFLLLWFVVGIYLLPSLLQRVRSHLSDEIMLIVSTGLCFGMVVLATKASFSAALGAFIMGSILAETAEGERIEHLLAAVKNLFAAVFFVSVGMMIDPHVLQKNFGVIVLITLFTVIGKLLGSGFGAVLSGRSLRQSMQAGMSLAQIGEFSFIIASLGVSLKVVSDFLYPIVIAVSAVTTFTTPYLIRNSDRMYLWIEKRLPQKLLDGLNQYERAMSTQGRENLLSLFWRTFGVLILLNTVVVLAIGLGVRALVLPIVLETVGNTPTVRGVVCLLTLVACSPFLYAVVLKTPKKIAAEAAPNLLRLSRLQFGIVILRAMLGLILIEVIVSRFATAKALPFGLLVAVPVLIFIFRKHIGHLYGKVEKQFLLNLNAKELAEMESLAQLPQLAPWNATVAQLVVSPNAKIAGLTLEETKFRSLSGSTIAMIDRGRRRIFAPGRAERILPYDELFLIGTDEQIAAAQNLIAPEEIADTVLQDEMFLLEPLTIEGNSRYANMTIRDMGVGAEFGGIIVGVESRESRLLNPESNVVLRPGDRIWIFGHRDTILKLKKAARGI